MEFLYIIEKLGRAVYSKIKKVEKVENDDTSFNVKKYRDFDGEVKFAFPNSVFCYETDTYNIDEHEECINGRKWNKKYQQLSSDFGCAFKLL